MTAQEEVIYKPTTEVICQDNGTWKKESFQELKAVHKIKKEKLPPDGWFMYFTAFVANLVTFTAGIGASWTSPVRDELEGPNTPLNAPIGRMEISLIASSLNIGQILGPLLFGYLADVIGRKKTTILIMIPQCVGLLILAFASDVRLYFLARFLHGFSFGGCFTVLTTYLAEISQQHSRGKFGCSYTFFISLGVFYPFPIGRILGVKWFCLSCLVPSIIFFALFPWFVPESPFYLIRKGDKAGAESALMKFRNKNKADVEKELLAIEEFVNASAKEKGHIGELFMNPTAKKALIIGFGLVILGHLTGIMPVLAFMHDFFEDASEHGIISADVGTSIIALIKTLIVFVTSAVIEKLGRKFLLFTSIALTSITTGCLALYFFLKNLHPTVMEPLWWFPLPVLTIYVIGFNLGIGPVAWAIISEIFPSNLRSVASSVVFSVCFMAGFSVMFTYKFIVAWIGLDGIFSVFSLCGIVTTLFVHFMVPETKGKSFAEIQEMLVHH